MATLKPIDRDAIREAVRRTPVVISLEEHSITGGLGSAIAEVLADEGLSPAGFARIGLPDSFTHAVGSQDYLLDHAGLSVDHLMRRIDALLEQAAAR
jgi:transketolase